MFHLFLYRRDASIAITAVTAIPLLGPALGLCQVAQVLVATQLREHWILHSLLIPQLIQTPTILQQAQL